MEHRAPSSTNDQRRTTNPSAPTFVIRRSSLVREYQARRSNSRRLAARGHRVTVLTRREDEERPPVEEVDGVCVYRHDFRLGRDARAFASVLREGARAYQRLADEDPFDVLNAHQPLAACAVL